MIKRVLLILCFILLQYTIFCQETTITGKVTNRLGDPLIGAIITTSPIVDSTKITTYTISKETGNFSIKTKKKGFFLKVSYLGFEKKYIGLEEITGNKFDIVLDESVNALREVILETNFVKDTVKLKIDSLRYIRESPLKEILKDSQGMTITDEGGISYMGVPILKILINEKEVFVNQNVTALENITYEMIKDIEVVNNHKDKFNIDFDNFNETILNINTKDKFKGVLKNIIELGGGYNDVLSLKGKSFLFSDKFNIFLTQNTNSILERTNNVNEVKERYKNKSSLFYQTAITDIMQGLDYVSKDISNQTYFILKREGKKLKLDGNIGFAYSRQKSTKNTNISSQKKNISEETIFEKRNGNIFFIDLKAVQLLDPTFSISYAVNFDIISKQPFWNTQKHMYLGNSKSNSNVGVHENDFLMNHQLNIKKIFSNNLLLNISTNYFSEDYDGKTSFLSKQSTFMQALHLENENMTIKTSLFYQRKSLLNFGFKSSVSKWNETLSSETALQNRIQRSLLLSKNSLVMRGRNRLLNYFISMGFQNYFINSTNKSKALKPFISSSLNYKITNKKSIGFSYENSYSLEKPRNALDSLFLPPNNIIYSTSLLLNNIQGKQNMNLYYTVNDVPKSSNFSINLAGSIDNDFSQTTFTDSNSEFNFLKRIIYDKKTSLFGKVSYSKGIYFSPKDHRLQFSGSMSGVISDSKIFRGNELVDSDNTLLQYKFGVAFIPQEMFFDEVKTDFSQLFNRFFIAEQKVSSLQTTHLNISLTKETKNSNFLLDSDYTYFRSPQNSFNKIDIGFGYRYYLSDNLSVFLKADSFLSLVGINNDLGNVTISSDNGIETETRYKNIYGFVIGGIQIKI